MKVHLWRFSVYQGLTLPPLPPLSVLNNGVSGVFMDAWEFGSWC